MYDDNTKFVDIKFTPAEKSITVPQIALNMRVNKRISIKQIIAVIKSKLYIEKNSSMFVFKDNKILQPNKLI